MTKIVADNGALMETQHVGCAERVKEMAKIDGLRMLLGIVLGLLIGALVAETCPETHVVNGVVEENEGCKSVMVLLAWPGNLWMRALKAAVLPMIVVSITLSCVMLRKQSNAKAMGRFVIVYYLLTTALAVLEGALMTSVIIGPNVKFVNMTTDEFTPEARFVSGDKMVVSQVLNTLTTLIPENIINDPAQLQILPVISAAIILGTLLPEASPYLQICEDVAGVVEKVVRFLIYVAPVGVGSLVFGELGQHWKRLGDIIQYIGYFIAADVAGLLLHLLVVLPALFYLMTGRNPYVVLKNVVPAMIVALSCSSSAGTLPVTTRCAVEKNNVSPAISSFVLPLGATINMDGSAIGFPARVLFIALIQGSWDSISAAHLLTICLTSALMSVGAAPIPSAGLVLLTVIMDAVNVPIGYGFGLIAAIEWIPDRFETCINICGDSLAAVIVSHKYAESFGLSDSNGQRRSRSSSILAEPRGV